MSSSASIMRFAIISAATARTSSRSASHSSAEACFYQSQHGSRSRYHTFPYRKPLLHDQKAEHNTCCLILSSGFVRRVQHSCCNDGTIRLGDLLFLNLVRNDLLDLVLQAQADLCDFFWVEWWWVVVLATCGQDCKSSASIMQTRADYCERVLAPASSRI